MQLIEWGVFEFWLREMPAFLGLSELGASVLVEAGDSVFVELGVVDFEAEGV
jgi:hypothetical protein